jgi:hypothetical protein
MSYPKLISKMDNFLHDSYEMAGKTGGFFLPFHKNRAKSYPPA